MFVKFCANWERQPGTGWPEEMWVDLKFRWSPISVLLKEEYMSTGAAGQWKKRRKKPVWWEYRETDHERAWANYMDRKYLHELIEQDPNKFLKEMTPNPQHDGVCVGLDLNHPHHVNLQKEFQDEVRRICKKKGLTEHPALLEPQQEQANTGGAAKDDTKVQDEIAALKMKVSELENEKTRLQSEQQTLIEERDQATQRTTTLEESNRTLQNQLEEQTASTQQISHEKHELQVSFDVLALEKKQLIEKSQQRCSDLEKSNQELQHALTLLNARNEDLKQNLSTLMNPHASWLTPWQDHYIAQGSAPEHTATPNGKNCTVGFITKTPKDKRYLVKLMLSDADHPTPSSLSGHIYPCSMAFSAYAKKIAMHVFAMLGHGFYYVPKDHLAKLKIATLATEDDLQATATVQPLHPDACKPHPIDTLIMCLCSDEDITPCAFMDCLAGGRAPSRAHIEGQTVPILGLMEMMAASRLLADTNVVGVKGENIGYVIERNDQGMPLAIRMIKLNADEAFNFSGENNQLTQSYNTLSVALKLKEQKDMQFAGQLPTTLQWSKLLEVQKNVFLHALKRGIALLNQPSIINPMIPEKSESFQKAWQHYRNVQPEIYGEVMREAKAWVPCGVPFEPKTYGAIDRPTESNMGGTK